MSIAWTHLLQAMCGRDGIDYHYRLPNGRYVRIGGEKKSWELQKMIERYFPKPNDPLRKNLEFFTGLRNRIEHRLTSLQHKALLEVVSGKCQAYLRNFEQTLTKEFSSRESLANELHLPLFLSNLNDEALKSIKNVRATVPKGVISYIEDFDRAVGEAVAANQAYDFRIVLIPKLGPKSTADLAVEFVNIDNLDAAQQSAINKAMVVVRDRQIPVANQDRMKPGAVVRLVRQTFPTFTMEAHRLAWHFFNVRPIKTSDMAANSKTDQRYCVYDTVHDDYTYYEAWVEKLIKELASDASAAIAKWKRAVRSTSAA
ncbi:MAG: DUF3644 domain-containing protein [Candidatus Eremiobacteraeota bacterium]|nr:DUF3644 domain-containing protein [Candidatus Eremiobacteraeota bacterium]